MGALDFGGCKGKSRPTIFTWVKDETTITMRQGNQETTYFLYVHKTGWLPMRALEEGKYNNSRKGESLCGNGGKMLVLVRGDDFCLASE